MIKVYFPGFWTQAHRTHEKRTGLEAAFAKAGVRVVSVYEPGCQAAFVGDRAILYPHVVDTLTASGLPCVHYVWDLYDANVHSPDHTYWAWYIDILRNATRVLVPSKCTGIRFVEHGGKDYKIVKSPIHIWDKPDNCPDLLRGAVVDVMRVYPDPNVGVVERACAELGIPCHATKTAVGWDDFRRIIANARLLVSAYWEASTGGLTLVEGYWHGVPSLVSNSPYNGAADYMGDRTSYFQWDDFNDLKKKIRDLYDTPPKIPSQVDRQKWIKTEYDEEVFAANVAAQLRSVL